VNCDDNTIILDAGTGIMPLGIDIVDGNSVRETIRSSYIYILAMFIGIIFRIFNFLDWH